jgi:hypothetical protein
MGYTTEFTGSIKIEPPLNANELEFLTKFVESRRMKRGKGPFYAGGGFAGQDHEPDIDNYNEPPDGQPGLWCKWKPAKDGASLSWSGAEKFYESHKWMAYLRSYFLVLRGARALDPSSFDFLEAHELSGIIYAVGEEASEDVWKMKVDSEGVFVARGTWTGKAMADVFGLSGSADDGDEYLYVEPGEALGFASNESYATFSDWERVDDFASPEEASRVMAFCERQEIAKIALPGNTAYPSRAL